ncbi:MAG: acyltransferase [Hyphomicrobiaceae bacterium]|nr:acyltransferase [Hyphomicrobiaceae bacterium]
MRYRSEIDGLRAVAVAPVVLFHAGLDGFSGGFVGVDVFFVISGFLITSLILHEKQCGTFTLRSFYERRARRILPALFVVVLACLPLAYLWMLPEEIKAFGASVLSVAFFVSNFVFYAQSGYFDQASELKPLLHTWSLAVEEQFYILFPLLLIALWRYSYRALLPGFILLFAASLLLAQTGGNFDPQQTIQAAGWSWQNLPSWGFYLLPARFWELMLGAIIAVVELRYGITWLVRSRPLSQAASLVGLALICYAVVAFDHATPFPSIYTLVPTLGAGLVIAFAREATLVHKLLSLRAVVGLGLISYSVYLWHHPLYVFARIWSLEQPSQEVFLALAGLSVVLAYITWALVEQPFRNRARMEARTVVRSSMAAAAILAAFFAGTRITKGFEHRFPTEQFIADVPVDSSKCRNKTDDPRNACSYGKGEPTVAIIGDSHARSLVKALGYALGQKGAAVLDLHEAGCAPVRNFLRLYTGDRCRVQDAVFDYLEQAGGIEHVVVATRWATKFEVSRFDNQEGGIELGTPTVFFPDVERAGREITLAEAVSDAVHELLSHGKTVILLYPIPEVGWDVPNYMAKLEMRGLLTDDISTSYAVFRTRNARVIAALDGVGEHENLHRVYPERLFCNTVREGRCMASLDMKALYTDTNHLSSLGASMVVREIVGIAKAERP